MEPTIQNIPQRPHRVSEVVKVTGFSRRTIYRWASLGILDAIQPAKGRGLRITWESLVRLLNTDEQDY